MGKSYSVTLKADSTNPITWSASGLPDGISISSSGKLTGKPTASGTYSVTLTASNSEGRSSVTLSLTVYDVAPKIKVRSVSGKVGNDFTLQFTTSAGTGTITWSLSGELPSGLSFDADTATIKGVPSEAWNNYITVKASNSAGEASKKVKLVIKAEKPSVTTKSLASGIINISYTSAIELTGTTPMTITITGLPNGLEYSSDIMKITGIPEQAGKFSVKFKAENVGKQRKITSCWSISLLRFRRRL